MHAADVERERAEWLRTACNAAWMPATIGALFGGDRYSANDLLGWPSQNAETFGLTKEDKVERFKRRLLEQREAEARTAARGH